MRAKFNFLTMMAVILALPAISLAHPGHEGHGGAVAGLAHPLSGIDHLAAMIAVGLLAAQIGGRAIWMLPLTFVGLMVGGGLLALAGVQLPMVEQGITASVLVLGVLIAMSIKWPTPYVMAIVGLFAIFHGHAHMAEMSSSHSAAAYAGGFIVATSMLHLTGIGIGLGMKRLTTATAIRVAGGCIAACGLLLAVNVI